ncbi:MAG: YraN family protein, partial [Patescibacteria group bacterium]
YKIIERNYRKPWGELDMVAYSETGVLVFVEVKTVTSHNVDKMLITAEDQMTRQKIEKLKRVSAMYAQSFPEKINEALGWRIDVLALTINGKDCVVKHYENIS